MFRPTPAALSAFRATSRAAWIKPSFQPHVGSVSPQYALKWVPSIMLWGATSGVLVTIALSGVPLFKMDVLNKTPLAWYYEDKTPDSDKPF